MLLPNLETNYFGSQNQFRNQFIMNNILIINLETNYNFVELF